MKKIPNFLVVLVLLALLFNSCSKDLTSDFEYGIDPANQKDLLCKSLRLVGNNIDGAMPFSKGIGLGISVSNPSVVEVSAGVLLFLPYTISDTSKVCKLYLQVDGANNYWETKLVVDPSSKSPYFSILIPKFVRDGDFNIVFSVGDCSGNVTRKYSTKTIVSPLVDCNTPISGAYGITVRAFDLGDNAGMASFLYEMYNIPDRLDIRYNGKWVASTGKLFDNNVVIPDCGNKANGFVSGKGGLSFYYDPKVSRSVEVYISGCNSGTKWDVQPICPEDKPLIGIHTSVSSNWAISNLWNHGHAWITITQKGKTTCYGLWPDTNDSIIANKKNNGAGSDMRIDFEKGTGNYSRFMYLTPEKYKEVDGFINKDWQYSLLTRNCATFAQKVWYVATSEELDANEVWNGSPTESPRKLGYSIEGKESRNPTGYLRPNDIPKVDKPLNSF